MKEKRKKPNPIDLRTEDYSKADLTSGRDLQISQVVLITSNNFTHNLFFYFQIDFGI